ncbi:hypothetical protein GALL_248370 [mine drainage metagenome]|uniref:Uncharacterized protein n=1 Tax=mine drainage metagenome TaxID=410659 RepID=A0A1J5RAX4_9ZZZZ
MKQQLTQQQIDELFAFCRKHYVHYYDVQLELVDHLANAIEEKMNADKNICFEKALSEVHASFGYKGFAGVVEAKGTSLYNKNKQLRLNLFFKYFTIPKIAFTLFLIAFFMFIGSVVPQNNLSNASAVIALVFILFEIFIAVKSFRIFKKVSKKLLLISSRYQQNFFSFLALQFLAQFVRFSDKYTLSITSYYFFSFIIGLMIVATLSYYDLCKKLLDISHEQYPQAFVS